MIKSFFKNRYLLWISCCLISCAQKNNYTAIDQRFTRSLVETKAAETPYRVSIPADYELIVIEDTAVPMYIFYPLEEGALVRFSGGFYFSREPEELLPLPDTCTKEFVKLTVLQQENEWMIYRCGEEYGLFHIMQNAYSSGFDTYAFFFGAAKSKEDLQKLLNVFYTMRKENES